MRRRFFLTLVFGFSFLALSKMFFLSAPAAEESSRLSEERIIGALQKKYEALASLRASFEQENEFKSLGQTTRSSGQLLLSKPSKLRVEYTSPDKQILVSDGITLWLYTARFNQVVVSKIERIGLGATPLLFLAGRGNLRKNFNILVEEVGVAKRSEGIWRAGQPHRIRLEPKFPGASFRRMWMEVEPESFRILALAYVDALGNKSRLRFSNVKEDISVTGGEFSFVAPPQVEVLHMPLREEHQ